MWKTSLLSLFHAHWASAVVLIVLAVLSPVIIVQFTVEQQSLACDLNSRLLPAASTLFGNVFYLGNPGEAKICLTVRLSGHPSGGLGLTPALDLYGNGSSGYRWLACYSAGTNCGGTTVSSIPETDVLPVLPIHVVWTIETSKGARPGDYLLQFGLCRGGGFIGLQIGVSNQTFQYNVPESLCPIITWGVQITFDGYTGLAPTGQTWPIPLPLLS